MENILKQIVNNTEQKRSFSIVVSDSKTRIKTWFKPPIQLDKKKDYEIAFINLETYYWFPNIDRSNNCFTYSPNLDPRWFYNIISECSYHVEVINEFIQREMKKNDHYDKANDMDNIEISANTNTLKSCFSRITMRLTSEKINQLIASWDFIVISTHQDVTGQKIW